MPAHTVKVGDDLIEEAQTFDSSVVDTFFCVEVGEVWDGGKHDSDLIIRLAVQLLQRKSTHTLALRSKDQHSKN